MENYIVRIYRRDNDDPDRVAGMLESVETQIKTSFTSLPGLRKLLLKKNPEPLAEHAATPAATADIKN